MATNVPPHNLRELDRRPDPRGRPNPELHPRTTCSRRCPAPTSRPAPLICGTDGIRQAYFATGRGHLTLRGRRRLRADQARQSASSITEIPFLPGQQSARCSSASPSWSARDGIEGISDLRDESNREGMRVVIELKKRRDAEDVVAEPALQA